MCAVENDVNCMRGSHHRSSSFDYYMSSTAFIVRLPIPSAECPLKASIKQAHTAVLPIFIFRPIPIRKYLASSCE